MLRPVLAGAALLAACRGGGIATVAPSTTVGDRPAVAVALTSPPVVVPPGLWDEVSGGAAGTVLVREEVVAPCWTGPRLLVHLELPLRPSDGGKVAPGTLAWYEARAARVPAPAGCGPVSAYRGPVELLRPGARLALLSAAPDRVAGFAVEPGHGAATLVFAADLRRLSELAATAPPAQTMWTWLTPAAPRLARRGEVVDDAHSGLTWQRGHSPPVGEASAYAYCDELVAGGRDDWRLPSVTEVATLLARDGAGVDPALLPSAAGWYWTWHDGHHAEPWVASFVDGGLADTHHDDPGSYGPYAVRCVAGHLARARWLGVYDGVIESTADALVDRVTGLAWARTTAPARSLGAARAACLRPWRLPTRAELRAQDLRGLWLDDDTAEALPSLWADDLPAGTTDPRPLGGDEPPSARCVRAAPAVVGDGPRWEHGAPLVDGPRRLFADGRLAAIVPEADGVPDGVARFFAADGQEVARLTFRNGLLDGPIAISGEPTLHAQAAGGRLVGPATLVDGVKLSGAYVDGARDGAWTVEGEGTAPGLVTYRAGAAHGPARIALTVVERPGPPWSLLAEGHLVDGRLDGAWTIGGPRASGGGVFVAGTGTWEVRIGGARLERWSARDGLYDGELASWFVDGRRRLQSTYVGGRLVAFATWWPGGQPWTVETATSNRHYAEDGALVREVTLVDRVAHGHALVRFDGGAWEEGEYVAGARDGPWTYTDPAHGIVTITTWRRGRVDGPPRHLPARR